MSSTVSTSPSPAPVLSAGNIVNAPTTTALGLGLGASILSYLSQTGLPSTTAGWFGIGIQALTGLYAIFGR